jgi:hypothetical protein
MLSKADAANLPIPYAAPMITRPAPKGPASGYHGVAAALDSWAMTAELDKVTTANAERKVVILLTGLFSYENVTDTNIPQDAAGPSACARPRR